MLKIKKTERLIGIILCIFLFCTTAFAASQGTDIKVKVDGKILKLDQSPVIMNGTTLVPVRPIFEALGFDVRWETQSRPDNRQINASRYINEETIRFNVQIDNNRMVVDYVDYGENPPRFVVVDRKFDVPPQVINGNTLIPVRGISEALGCKVEWLESENMVVIDTTNAKVVPIDDTPQPADIFKAEMAERERKATEKKAEEESNLVEKPAPDPNVVIYSDTNKPIVGATPGHILKDPNGSGVDNFAGSYRSGSIGQCAWYAEARFYEVHNMEVDSMFGIGAIQDWLINAYKFDEIEAITDKTDVRSLSIATYAPPKGKEIGHVVFVEYVEKDTNGNPIYVYITEANGGNTLNKGEFDPGYDGIVQKISYDEFISKPTLLGYIIPSK